MSSYSNEVSSCNTATNKKCDNSYIAKPTTCKYNSDPTCTDFCKSTGIPCTASDSFQCVRSDKWCHITDGTCTENESGNLSKKCEE